MTNSNVVLSILIATLDSRRQLFERMVGDLSEQVRRERLETVVEILCERDDGTVPTGTKRNRLMDRAAGRFLVFVNDDDEVSDEYVRRIVAAAEEHADVDVFGLVGEITFRGAHPRRFIMSTRFGDYVTRNGQYERPPHHLNPMRADVARGYRFEQVWTQEDSERALRMVRDGALRREHMIDAALYYYRSRRPWVYQWLLDRTEPARHLLGLRFVNLLRARRWLRQL